MGLPKITKIVIEVGDKKFELTLDEAKSLRDILTSTFPEQKITYIPSPYPVPTYPRPSWKDDYWRIQYKTTSDASGVMTLSNGGGK